MGERTTRRSVVFVHPFQLAGVDGIQPPGIYDVETVEQQLDGLSFLAYRRLATTITLRGNNVAAVSRQVHTIDPEDLAAALERDAEAPNEPPQI